jgi:hypothetical protein
MIKRRFHNPILAAACWLVFSLHPYTRAQQSVPANQPETPNKGNAVIVISDQTSTVRIAQPNELIGVNGRVMRVAEFMALLSADTSLVQRPRIPEKQNSSDSQQVAPQSKKH